MKSRSLVLTLIVSALFFQGISGSAQADRQSDQELRDEIAALKQGQEKMRADLAEIKRILQQGQRPAAAPSGPNVAGKIFDLGNNPVMGNDGAKIALLEFTDYQCPFCYRHTTQTQPQIEREYIDAGKIRYVSLDMPIPSLHPLAFKASEASHCAADQGKFWEMRQRMFAYQKSLEPWNAHAEALGLDVAQFEACLVQFAQLQIGLGDFDLKIILPCRQRRGGMEFLVHQHGLVTRRIVQLIQSGQVFHRLKIA